ncbi:glycosyltransferase family 61 protein [Pseudaquidulcibacter saccharophilus]|uniref:glycosyltransferase family 61 protein n=1 Tax=Pseudaquidulcibacter saccharophilus TaxID=2831900 RepID=UPI001EFF3EEB|nr:glycosyltransferase family 61 protein [Pseudaquidulcibacter saccharophilus]
MSKLIAFADEIYKNGGYYDVSPIGELIDISGKTAFLEKKLFDSSEVKRAKANLYSHDDNFINNINNLYDVINTTNSKCSASYAIKLKDVIIHDNILYVKYGNEYREFYYTSRPNDAPHARHLSQEEINSAAKRTINCSDSEIIYFGGVGGFNYGHFLIDDLAKVKYIRESDVPVTILMQSYGKIDCVKVDAISNFTPNHNNSFKFILPGEVVYCPEITYICPISFHPYTKNLNAINYVKEMCKDEIGDSQKCNRRIFVGRSQKMGRNIANLKQLLPIIKEYDFEIIEPEKHSFRAQLKMFQEAEIVVGIMGAAMCNTIFAPTNLKTIYLAPNEWVEPFYWDLAASMGHEYNVIYGQRRYDNELAHFDNFEIDPSILQYEIEKAIS